MSKNYLGFWIDAGDFGGNQGQISSASEFVNGYFGTPPYPYFAQISIGFDAFPASDYIPFWTNTLQLMQQNYPDTKLMFQVFVIGTAYNPSQTEAQQFASYQQFLQAILPYNANIKGVFFEPEYLETSSWVTVETNMYNYAKSLGIQWIETAGGNAINDTTNPSITFLPFPWSGAVNGLYTYDVGGVFIGAQVGFQAVNNYVENGTGNNAFPSAATALPASESTDISTDPLAVATYNQLIVDYMIQAWLKRPSSNDDENWLIWTSGYSSNGGGYTFTGATGETRQTAMWDNPLLRGWIYNSPDYMSNFVLSTSSAPPPPPPPTQLTFVVHAVDNSTQGNIVGASVVYANQSPVLTDSNGLASITTTTISGILTVTSTNYQTVSESLTPVNGTQYGVKMTPTTTTVKTTSTLTIASIVILAILGIFFLR